MCDKIKLKAILSELDKPTKNGHYYSKEALEYAFQEPCFEYANRNNLVPVRLHCGPVIGTCSATLNYPEITIEMNVAVDEYEKEALLKSGVVPTGLIRTDCSNGHSVPVATINYIKLTGFEVVTNPAINCSMELIQD